MTTEQVWWGATCAVATTVALVSLVVALRARRRAAHAESLVVGLAERIGGSGPPAATSPAAAPPVGAPADSAYVITGVNPAVAPEHVAPVAQPIEGRLFADIVAREAVVTAASWTAGLRRALSASNRNRIRFEVRQETRRATRERRVEAKQALREFRERERSGALAGDVREDVA